MEKTKEVLFNKRAFISISMFAAGFVLPFSGLMNHLSQFDPMTVQRHFWMTVHNISAILFAVFAVIHIVYNWRSFKHYVNKVKTIAISREAIAAALVVIIIVGLFSSHALIAR